jgi:hypothetical protein
MNRAVRVKTGCSAHWSDAPAPASDRGSIAMCPCFEYYASISNGHLSVTQTVKSWPDSTLNRPDSQPPRVRPSPVSIQSRKSPTGCVRSTPTWRAPAYGPHTSLQCAPEVLTPAYVTDGLTRTLCVRSPNSPPKKVTGHAGAWNPVSCRSSALSTSHCLLAIIDRTQLPVSSHSAAPPFLFLSPQPLCPGFQLANHKV